MTEPGGYDPDALGRLAGVWVLLLGGLAMGALTTRDGLREGAFGAGPRVQASVVRTYNAVDRELLPDYRLEAKHEGGAVELSVYESALRYEPGDEVELRLDPRDPGRAMLEEDYQQDLLLELPGYSVKGLALIWPLMVAGALFLLLRPQVYIRRPSEAGPT